MTDAPSYAGRGETQASGSYAVRAMRVESAGSADDFPTPCWATRALFEDVLPHVEWGSKSVWEPAAGRGTMSRVIEEYAAAVHATDAFDYGFCPVQDYLVDDGWDRLQHSWLITNPPFNLAEKFILKALHEAVEGVAMLVRLSFLEGGGRYRRLFSLCPPTKVAIFVDRVPMYKKRLKLGPGASTATAYCWVVWEKAARDEHRWAPPVFDWIAPGARARLTRLDDRERFEFDDRTDEERA